MKTNNIRRNTCRRVLAMLTALTMSLSMLQCVAFADETPDAGENGNPEITVIAVDGTSDESSVPDPTDSTDGTEDTDAAGETESTGGDVNSAKPDEPWDITKTERPGMTNGEVGFDAGDRFVTEDGNNILNEKFDPNSDNWDIFYDAENDVYKVTFNIAGDAKDFEQVIDLTKALELLGQYAETGKQELADAIAALEKPVMGEPDMEKPTEPGKPENLDENLDAAYNDILTNVPRSDEGEPKEDFDYADVIANKTGLSKNDPFVQASASRMYDQAMVDWVMDNWDEWKANDHVYAKYFGDPDTMLYYGCGIECRWKDGVPSLKSEAPKFEVDTESPEYQAYLEAMAEYEKAMAEVEDKYAGDKAAYDKAVADLRAEFDRRVGANVLEPGDVKKFELYLTSDSKHTYKYQNGSFTLATPDWGK